MYSYVCWCLLACGVQFSVCLVMAVWLCMIMNVMIIVISAFSNKPKKTRNQNKQELRGAIGAQRVQFHIRYTDIRTDMGICRGRLAPQK